MKTILAPTDFSEPSVEAVNYAADMARTMGAQLVILHVCAVPVSFREMSATASVADRWMDYAQSQMTALKSDIEERVQSEVPVVAEVNSGDVVMEIDEACSRYQPYAVIISAETMGPIERWLAEAKTLAVEKHLNWPLLVVPAGANFRNIRRIGVACDLKKVLNNIPAQEIRELVQQFKAKLHILHVCVETDEHISEESIGEKDWLIDILSDLHPKFHFIFDEEVESGIQAWADTQQLDMLILIPRKQVFPASLFRRRRSPRLVMHAHIPALAVTRTREENVEI
ncbi:MAG: universal stress protein [Chitinophagaceae bacterium]|nr:universal stress protein [Chitinophagaceae bacterium]